MTSFLAFAWLFVQTVDVKMASVRLVKFSDVDEKSFSEQQKNANTKNKSSYDLKLSKEFLASEEEMRKSKKLLPPSCKIKFVLGVRKKNGE